MYTHKDIQCLSVGESITGLFGGHEAVEHPLQVELAQKVVDPGFPR